MRYFVLFIFFTCSSFVAEAKGTNDVETSVWHDSSGFFFFGILSFILLLWYLYNYVSRLNRKRKLQVETLRLHETAIEAIIAAEENEKKRIAWHLQDGVGQMISVVKMNLSRVQVNMAFTSIEDKVAFDKAMFLVDESCQEVIAMSRNMMSSTLLKKGLCIALKEFIDKIDSKLIKINFYCEGFHERLETTVETVLYRILQECINNVIKHATANHLEIALIKDAYGVAVTIEDDGKGFDKYNVKKPEAIGLNNIMARVNYLKGIIEFDSSPGKGTLVAIHIPLI